MYKNRTVLFCMLALLLQTFSKAVILLDFYVNRSYISRTLCENRNKPQLNCCGKCQLRKQLRQEEKNGQTPERKTSQPGGIFSIPPVTTAVPLLFAGRVAYVVWQTIGRPVHRAVTTFRPPDTVLQGV